MRKRELVQEFVRVTRKEKAVEFRVCKITWDGPHSPVGNWKLYSTIRFPLSEREIASEIDCILADKRYFRRCCKCRALNPTGWMGGETCHRCMENEGCVF